MSSVQSNGGTFSEPEMEMEPELCVNNCGFYGSPATMNLCSKCFKASQADTVGNNSLETTIRDSNSTLLRSHESEILTSPESSSSCSSSSSPAVPKAGNRCKSCNRKVGLLGFVCKCQSTFCGTHRYPEKRSCEFDFKKTGREAIKKANHLVKADKITRF